MNGSGLQHSPFDQQHASGVYIIIEQIVQALDLIYFDVVGNCELPERLTKLNLMDDIAVRIPRADNRDSNWRLTRRDS